MLRNMSGGKMYGSEWEGGQVFAWRLKPDSYAIENSGAHFGVIISFESYALFTSDKTSFDDPKIACFYPVKTIGPIVVKNVKIVEVIQ